MNCSECRWWNRDGMMTMLTTWITSEGEKTSLVQLGQCRRRSPHHCEHKNAEWPRTAAEDWCGEWEEKKQP